MSEIEKRAQALLAEAFACDVSELSAAEVRAVRAVLASSAALAPPEGYLLVPVEPTEKMQRAGAGITCTNVDEAWEVWHAMIAARPEVKP